MRLPSLLILPFALLAMLAPGARAGTVKVSPDPGNNPIATALTQLGDGDKLVLSAGTYDERITLIGLTKVKVLGKGEVIIESDEPSASVAVFNCTNVVIQGLTIRNAPTQGMLVTGSSGVTVRKCSVVDPLTMGLEISTSTHVSVQKCSFTGGTFGIYLSGAAEAQIKGNSIDAPDSYGVVLVLMSLPGTRISKNTISGIQGSGIELDGPGNQADRNTISGCLFGVTTPFTGGDMAGSAILGNTVVDTLVALRTFSSGGLEIAKNKLLATQASALQVAAIAQDVVVTKNRIDGGGESSGIDDEGTGSLVSKNKVVRTVNYGIRARGTQGTFERNTVIGTPSDGFDVLTGGHVFTRNKATGNGGFDLNSSNLAETDNTYEKNTFGSTAFDN